MPNNGQQLLDILLRVCDGTADKTDVQQFEKLIDNDDDTIEKTVEILMLLSCFQCFDGHSLFTRKGHPIEEDRRASRNSTESELKTGFNIFYQSFSRFSKQGAE